MLYTSPQFEFIVSNGYYYFFTKAVRNIKNEMVFNESFSFSNLDETGYKIVKDLIINQYNSFSDGIKDEYSIGFIGEHLSNNITKTQPDATIREFTSIDEISDYISENLVCLKVEPNKVDKIFPLFKSFHKDLIEGSDVIDHDIVVEAFSILVNEGVQDLIIFSNFLKNGPYHEFETSYFESIFLLDKINLMEITTVIDDFCDFTQFNPDYAFLEIIKNYYIQLKKIISSLDKLENLSNIKDVISMDYKIGQYKSQINLLNIVSLFENLLCGDVAQNHLIDDSISLHFSRNTIFILEIINQYESDISDEKTIIHDTKVYKKMLKEIYGLRSKIIHGSYNLTQSEASKICTKNEYKPYYESYKDEYDSISVINAFLSDILSRILHLYISKPNLFNILKGV